MKRRRVSLCGVLPLWRRLIVNSIFFPACCARTGVVVVVVTVVMWNAEGGAPDARRHDGGAGAPQVDALVHLSGHAGMCTHAPMPPSFHCACLPATSVGVFSAVGTGEVALCSFVQLGLPPSEAGTFVQPAAYDILLDVMAAAMLSDWRRYRRLTHCFCLHFRSFALIPPHLMH